jgi:DNA-binding transcriptional LysR family regulator
VAGPLSIATTHTQSRYVLPQVIRGFLAQYPDVRVHLHQGTSEQIAEMSAHDRVDLAIATGSEELFPHLLRLPLYRWHRAIIVPSGHPLAAAGRLTLNKLAVLNRNLYLQFLRPSFSASLIRHGRARSRRSPDCVRFGCHQDIRTGLVWASAYWRNLPLTRSRAPI